MLDAQQAAAARAVLEREEALQISTEFIAEDEARKAMDVLTQQLKEKFDQSTSLIEAALK